MNELRVFVTFNADFPDDTKWNDSGDMVIPGGQTIAEVLKQALESHGCTCSCVYQHSHYGWTFDTTCDSFTSQCVLAAAEGAWLLQLVPKRSLVSLLTGKSHVAKIRLAQTCVHTILKSEDRFSEILWHTRQHYESRRQDRASPVP